ncbi:MAG: HEAT repeat domain-containing protein [Deltaproteobacteria bacterium]|nr:HEAT repeat domain-containing protein [Deltaproteobacteria bacterium]
MNAARPAPRIRARVARAALVTVAVVAAPNARAEDRVEAAKRELTSNDDFRVRTQAALALGASHSADSVPPLCAALADDNTTVRAAAAAALGKLALGGKDCLTARRTEESNPSVLAVLEKSLAKVEAAGRPALGESSRYYLAIAPVTDKMGREGTEVEELVRGALESAATSLEGAVVAPRDEKPADAKSLLGRYKKVKPLLLWPKAQAPDYSGGRLTIRLELSVLTYPGKALKGSLSRRLSMGDVPGVDHAAEDELLRQAAESAFQQFAANLSRFE